MNVALLLNPDQHVHQSAGGRDDACTFVAADGIRTSCTRVLLHDANICICLQYADHYRSDRGTVALVLRTL
jgi:hypothetical protein